MGPTVSLILCVVLIGLIGATTSAWASLAKALTQIDDPNQLQNPEHRFILTVLQNWAKQGSHVASKLGEDDAACRMELKGLVEALNTESARAGTAKPPVNKALPHLCKVDRECIRTAATAVKFMALAGGTVEQIFRSYLNRMLIKLDDLEDTVVDIIAELCEGVVSNALLERRALLSAEVSENVKFATEAGLEVRDGL